MIRQITAGSIIACAKPLPCPDHPLSTATVNVLEEKEFACGAIHPTKRYVCVLSRTEHSDHIANGITWRSPANVGDNSTEGGQCGYRGSDSFGNPMRSTCGNKLPCPEHPSSALVSESVDAERMSELPEWFLLHFDDADRHNEIFGGEGAYAAALARFEDARSAWSCYLFKRVATTDGELQSRAGQPGNPSSSALASEDGPLNGKPTEDQQREPVTADSKGQPRADEASRSLSTEHSQDSPARKRGYADDFRAREGNYRADEDGMYGKLGRAIATLRNADDTIARLESKLRKSEAELNSWKTGAMADATGHMFRCAKVDDAWSCAAGCAIERLRKSEEEREQLWKITNDCRVAGCGCACHFDVMVGPSGNCQPKSDETGHELLATITDDLAAARQEIERERSRADELERRLYGEVLADPMADAAKGTDREHHYRCCKCDEVIVAPRTITPEVRERVNSIVFGIRLGKYASDDAVQAILSILGIEVREPARNAVAWNAASPTIAEESK